MQGPQAHTNKLRAVSPLYFRNAYEIRIQGGKRIYSEFQRFFLENKGIFVESVQDFEGVVSPLRTTPSRCSLHVFFLQATLLL